MRCIVGKGGGGGRRVLPFDALDERVRSVRRRRHGDSLWQRADDGTSASKTLMEMWVKSELCVVGVRPRWRWGQAPVAVGTGPGGGGDRPRWRWGQAPAAGLWGVGRAADDDGGVEEAFVRRQERMLDALAQKVEREAREILARLVHRRQRRLDERQTRLLVKVVADLRTDGRVRGCCRSRSRCRRRGGTSGVVRSGLATFARIICGVGSLARARCDAAGASRGG